MKRSFKKKESLTCIPSIFKKISSSKSHEMLCIFGICEKIVTFSLVCAEKTLNILVITQTGIRSTYQNQSYRYNESHMHSCDPNHYVERSYGQSRTDSNLGSLANHKSLRLKHVGSKCNKNSPNFFIRVLSESREL